MRNAQALLQELHTTKTLLNQSEQRFQLITRHIPVLMAQYSADLERVEYINDLFVDWFKLNQNKAVRSGMAIDEVHSKEGIDELRNLVSKCRNQNYQPYSYEIFSPNIVRNSEMGLYSSGILIPMQSDKNSEPYAYICALRDTTKEKRIEIEKERLKQKAEEDSARQKREFLVHVTHELCTPLTEIQGLLENIFPELECYMTDEQQKMARDAIHSGEMLKFVIDDLLDLSRIEAGKLEIESHEFDILQFLEESTRNVSSISKKKNIPIIVYASSAALSSTYNGDMIRLKQLLLNLMRNALKYSTKGWIGVSVEVAEFVANVNQMENCALLISVKDQGLGISEEAKTRLFKPFCQAETGTTRKYGGTGLGLTITEKLAELMKGFVDFDSIYGKGSDFWIYIPLRRISMFKNNAAPITNEQVKCRVTDPIFNEMLERWHQDVNQLTIDSAQSYTHCYTFENDEEAMKQSPLYTWKLKDFINQKEHKRTTTSEKEDRNPKKIPKIENTLEQKLKGHALCADDNSINRLLLRKYLNSFGLTVTVVNNGLEALNYFKLNYENIDVIFMDCLMPVMDGYECARLIRQFEKQAKVQRCRPIIAATANSLQEDAKKCLEVGMNDYLTKPFNKSKIYELLEKYLTKI